MPDSPIDVSILMPLYNCASSLARSVGSVRAQTYQGWELLLIDDGSSDGTADLAQKLAADDRRIRVLTMPANKGAAAARNHGLEHAKGRYIAFLDADDRWRPEKLQRQLQFMKRHDAALSFTAYSRVGDQGALKERVPAMAVVTYNTLLKRNIIGCLTAIYDSKQVGKIPMPELWRQHDFALWLQIVRQSGPAYGLDEDLAIYQVASGSLSGNKLAGALDNWRIYRRLEKLTLLKSLWCFANYASFGIRHRLFQ